MAYNITNDTLKQSYERYRNDSAALRDLASDVALMRALVEASVQDNADNPTKFSCDRSSLEPGDKFYVYGFGPHESVNNN